jgi:hypothetical protein
MAGLWAGLSGGLALFVAVMATTYGSIGWYVHDQQVIADAHLHGQSSAPWIVGGNLGGSIFMLICIPVLSAILSIAGSALSRNLRRARRPGTVAGPVPGA